VADQGDRQPGLAGEPEQVDDLGGGGDVEAYVPDQAERPRPSPPWTTSRRSPARPSSPMTCSANPPAFMVLQDVQELSNFFERRVSVYQVGVRGDASFDHDF
jgi:hypothetical protein